MKRSFVLFVLAISLVLGACGSDTAPAANRGQPDAETPEPDGEWVLQMMVLEGDMAIPLPEQPLDFRIDGDSLGGSAGCNSMGGTVQFVADDSVVIDELFWTEMACEPASLMDFEQQYTSALLAVTHWSVQGDQLNLDGPGVSLRYTPRVAPPDLPLVGTTWTLDTFFDGDSASHSIGMDQVRVHFSDSGVRAEAMCWSIEGPATIEPGSEGNLSVDWSTAEPDFSCEDRSFFDDVKSRFNEVAEYRIHESRLTLGRAGTDQLGFVGLAQ